MDQDFAHYYWPNGGALGHRLFEGGEQGKDADAFTIVGVVGSVKQAGLTEEAAQGAVYYPYAFHSGDIFVAVRTSLPPESLGLTLQGAVRQVDPDLPVNDVRTMEARVTDSLAAQRTSALLALLFSAIALLLVAIGSYGVLSYAVEQRRREIGVRMALGARPAQIRNQFLMLAFRLLAYGVVLGGVGAWLTGRAMQSLLFHVPGFNLGHSQRSYRRYGYCVNRRLFSAFSPRRANFQSKLSALSSQRSKCCGTQAMIQKSKHTCWASWGARRRCYPTRRIEREGWGTHSTLGVDY